MCWKTGYDISANSVSDNLVEDNISLQVNPKTDETTLEDTKATPASDNPVEDNISLQVNPKTDQTTLEDTKAPTATPSPDEGPRTSTRKRKPPTTKSGDFLW